MSLLLLLVLDLFLFLFFQGVTELIVALSPLFSFKVKHGRTIIFKTTNRLSEKKGDSRSKVLAPPSEAKHWEGPAEKKHF